jgi:hypothetical protein
VLCCCFHAVKIPLSAEFVKSNDIIGG